MPRTREPATTAAPELRKLRAPLLRWYARHKRDLPWRRTRDPYAIWVSEVMLQQTRVATVLPYFQRFLEQYPDVASLARAKDEEVLACWSGLGYYRRARNLHRGAREVVARHDGRVPRVPEELRALPGVGRYTAGAIASIAFDLPEPVLDGNIRRVLTRVLALSADRVGKSREQRELWQAARELARGPRPGEVNQALMELGALVCTSTSPRCPGCPWRRDCRARVAGHPQAYPATDSKPAPQAVRVAVAWLRRGKRVLLEHPNNGNPLRGTWDLPAIELEAEASPIDALREKLCGRGLEVSLDKSIARVRHSILHRRLTLEIYAGRLSRGRVADLRDVCWVAPAHLATKAISGATRKITSAVWASC